MNLHLFRACFRWLVGLLVTLVTISPAQTSDIVCPGSWKQVSNSGPPAGYFFSLAFEPRGPHGHVMLFAGDDTWTWDGTVWIHAADTGPSGRSEPAMAYDIAQRQMMLFGGDDIDQNTWTWDGTKWAEAATGGGPPARSGHGMAYDGARHRTVLFGGTFAEADIVFGDTWEWDGALWTQVATTGPAPRWALSLAYDKSRGKSVLFGGTSDAPRVPLQDTWEWMGPTYACSGRSAGDLNCDHLVNHQDLTIVDAALGLPACSAADPRDLNHDGKINAQDAQLLANKCTKLGCK